MFFAYYNDLNKSSTYLHVTLSLSRLELVWMNELQKSQPSFLQILHISPILDKITQPFHTFQQKST